MRGNLPHGHSNVPPPRRCRNPSPATRWTNCWPNAMLPSHSLGKIGNGLKPLPLARSWHEPRAPSTQEEKPAILPLAAVKNLELVAVIRRKERGHVAKALSEGWGGEQRVLALAQVMVVEVDGQRQ